ncbi:MAG: DUF362 domain-containing protein [Verrucomicrobia bacterium]|nr:DUF362 domain-containing protein [Verrucomicrobiota bacterium]
MNPKGLYTRRDWLVAAVAAGLTARQLALGAETAAKLPPAKLAMPGLWPGRVVAVTHPGCRTDGQFRAEPIAAVMRRGMMELTGAPDDTQAWRTLFERGDVVGIKVNPVGGPHVISSPEVLHEIVRGLEAAGVRRRDIVVYDRYRRQFLQWGFDKWLPDGVRWTWAVEDHDNTQQKIDGYDPAHYMDMAVTLPGQNPEDEKARRSYAARFITQDVGKLINLPVLKHHQSAGVTLALKNLSHGLVNNVARSHSSRSLNVCGAFIPAVVSMPIIRNKTVLHILDGIRGVYHGGPYARPQFIWDHQTMYFASDPVALDHVGWKEIEQRRKLAGLKPIVEAPPDEFSTFVHGQPEHIEIAGALGLGVFAERRIRLRTVRLGA